MLYFKRKLVFIKKKFHFIPEPKEQQFNRGPVKIQF